MSRYSDAKGALQTRLDAVSGIGNVFAYNKHATTEEELRAAFTKASKINVCFFFRDSAVEAAEGIGTKDITLEDEIIQDDESWIIRIMFGYDGTGTSEDVFQAICDALRDSFRFEPAITGVFKVMPLQQISAQIWQMLNGQVLVHRADFRLTLQYQITKT